MPPINILTPSNSAHWNKVLSALKVKETKQDRFRVFSFSPEVTKDEESTINPGMGIDFHYTNYRF